LTPVADASVVSGWIAALEQRALKEVTSVELARAIRALSQWYVQKRDRLSGEVVFGGAGKRAAFSLYYGLLHFCLVRELISALGLTDSRPTQVVDLGCGTGVAGAALALSVASVPQIYGYELSPWASAEARWTLHMLGLAGRVWRRDLLAAPLQGRVGTTVVAAFAVNELATARRERLQHALARAVRSGARLLVVEPVAKSLTPWWDSWQQLFCGLGGRAD
jgi:methylase of polypeptide subunit release factors